MHAEDLQEARVRFSPAPANYVENDTSHLVGFKHGMKVPKLRVLRTHTFSSTKADTGRQLKQSVNVFQSGLFISNMWGSFTRAPFKAASTRGSVCASQGGYDFVQLADPQIGMFRMDSGWAEEETMLPRVPSKPVTAARLGSSRAMPIAIPSQVESQYRLIIVTTGPWNEPWKPELSSTR